MKNLLLLVSFFIFQFSFGQTLTPKVDRTSIKIGEPIKYEVKVEYKEGDKIIFPTITDSLSHHIEVLGNKLDTIKTDGKSEIVQQLDLTGYDAGKFSIPSISIQKNGENLVTKQLEIDIQDIEVEDILVIKKVSPTIDAEAIRLIRELPIESPEIRDDIPVSGKYILPIIFDFED